MRDAEANLAGARESKDSAQADLVTVRANAAATVAAAEAAVATATEAIAQRENDLATAEAASKATAVGLQTLLDQYVESLD